MTGSRAFADVSDTLVRWDKQTCRYVVCGWFFYSSDYGS